MKPVNLLIALTAWMLVALPTSVSAEENGWEEFRHEGAGFSISKPSGWIYQHPEDAEAPGKLARMDDQELIEMISKDPDATLVIFTRYPEPHSSLNPQVKVGIFPLPMDEEIPPVKDLLGMVVDRVRKEFPDMTFVDEVQNADVDGNQGAYTKIKYTVDPEGEKQPTLFRMWLIPRGKFIFVLAMSGPQEGPDVSEDVFSQVLSSIKIDK